MSLRILASLAALGLALSFSACGKSTAPASERVERKIAAGALIVDVRSPEETASGMYKGAVNIPIEQAESRLAEFGAKDKPVVLYCRSGARAGRVKQMLESKGYTDVTNAGGFADMPAAK
jgi:phage shock protein E